MRSVRRLALAASLIASLLVGCNANNPSSEAAADRPPAAAERRKPGEIVLTAQMEKRAGIRVATAQKRSLVNSSLFSSTIETPSSGSGVVTSPVSGTVTRILADIGQSVRRGQVLAYITSPDLADAQSNYLIAGARVQEAQAQAQLISGRINLARADLERETLLSQKGISSLRDKQAAQARLDSVYAELASSRSMLAAARTTQQAARARLGAYRSASAGSISNELPLLSPVSGVVTQRMIQPGQSVNPATAVGGGSGHLFTISSLNEVWAMLEVPQSEVASLKLGTPVQFTSEVAPGQIFRGRVIRLGESFDSQARTVGVRAAIANPKGTLKPGMLVLARAAEGTGSRAVLTVPTAAIQQVEGKNVVFIKTASQRYRTQPVTLGEHSAQFTEVKSGVASGAQVVTDGSFVLKSEALKATLEG